MQSDSPSGDQPVPVDHAGLDPAVWARFLSFHTGADDGAGARYYQDWLRLQVSLLPQVGRAVLLLGEPGSGQYPPRAVWPNVDTPVSDLAELAEDACEQQTGLVTDVEPADGIVPLTASYLIAWPLLIDGKVFGAVAVEVESADEKRLQSVMSQLQWGTAWLELEIRRQQMRQDRRIIERLQTAIELLAGVHAEGGFQPAAMALVTAMAGQLGCERVSLGLIDNKGHCRVEAISHSAEFGKQMNLVRLLGNAMDEAVEQRREIVWPVPEGQALVVCREHRELAARQELDAVMTLPLISNGRIRGAVCLERSGGPFGEDEILLAQSILGLTGPALIDKRENDRHILKKINDAFWRQCRRLFGKGYPGRKLAALSLILAVVALSVVSGQYRLSADTLLEGRVQRIVTAPFQGYLREAGFRAGDIVRKGQVLARLDDRDLRLERLRQLSELTKLQRQKQEALATRNRAELNIIDAQIARVTAELQLTDSRIGRTRIRAPIDGLIVRGDLSQRLGVAVKEGEELFTIAPLKDYRVIIQVDERRIADVREGQRGSLILTALPNREFPFRVVRITPVSVARDGRNFFRVEARLLRSSSALRPGMEGVAKIDIDRRKLIDIWTRDLREWFTLWWWSW